MTPIALKIPAFAFHLMATETPEQAYADLLATGSTTVERIQTFGFIDTPIQRNDTGEIVAHVTLWTNKDVTVVRAEDGKLLHRVPECGYLEPEKAVELFQEVWSD